MKMIKRSRQIIWALLFVLLLSPALLFAGLPKLNREPYLDYSLLLLNSGLTRCETSKVKYILWTDDSRELSSVYEILRDSGHVWQEDIFSDFTGKKIYKFTLESRVNKDGEKLIPNQLNLIEKEIKGKRILLYFQQQLDETIDVIEYSSSSKLKNVRKIETESLVSITGYSNSVSKTVQSANLNINIQIITNKQGDRAKTLLAIPALLNDF